MAALARAHRPTVVLMDIRMPRVDGLDATAAICAELHARDRTQLVVIAYQTGLVRLRPGSAP